MLEPFLQYLFDFGVVVEKGNVAFYSIHLLRLSFAINQQPPVRLTQTNFQTLS